MERQKYAVQLCYEVFADSTVDAIERACDLGDHAVDDSIGGLVHATAQVQRKPEPFGIPGLGLDIGEIVKATAQQMREHKRGEEWKGEDDSGH